ncbi:MAG: transglycosylase domain-containing protein [Patescibacteria group bacterium]
MIFRSLRKRRKHNLLLWILAVVTAGVFLFLIAGILLFAFIKLPTLEDFRERKVAESTKIYDRTGKILLWEVHGEERRTVVPFENISRNVKNATIAIEDSNFYSHHGISPISLFRVIFINIFQGKQVGSGGSTITQQLVKNTLLTSEQTLIRKAKEIIIAIKLESAYGKDDILNLYLNEIPYGSNIYGVESAAQNFFGVSASDISLAQAAYIAAIPKAPTRYSPYGNNRKDLEARKNLVLERMRTLQYISTEEYEEAKKEKVVFLPHRRQGLLAPHFVMYVREILNEKYGEEVVEQGGLEVITTLDANLQAKAEEIIARRAPDMQKNFNASNIALTALDPKTGHILAMIGSRDYFDINNDGNFNVALAHRQPGSAFKPLVYATAFKKGYTPETVVFDLETNFAAGGDPYIPQNYDDKFRGPITLREALAQSLNIPAVKTLYLAGIDDSINTARDFGMTTLTNKSRYGLTLVLGGGEVSLLELTSAYGVFANQGIKANHHPIIQVKDKDGSILEEETVRPEPVIDTNIANMISSILSDNTARTPAFGARSPLYFDGISVAVKTGTTNDYRDVWTVGYNPNIVVGTWAGNNDNSSMTKNVAGFIIAPLWREFMDAALEQVEKTPFTPPQPTGVKKPVLRGIWKGSRSYEIDKISGNLATPFTPADQREERVTQEVHSILYWVQKDNPDGPIPTNPVNDPQFSLWEGPVRLWAERNGYRDGDISGKPTDYDSSHSPENWPVITFPKGEEQKTFDYGDELIFHPTITGRYAIVDIEIFVDGEFVRSEKGTLSNIEIGDYETGSHTLKLKVYDVIGNRQEREITFTVAAP